MDYNTTGTSGKKIIKRDIDDGDGTDQNANKKYDNLLMKTNEGHHQRCEHIKFKVLPALALIPVIISGAVSIIIQIHNHMLTYISIFIRLNYSVL